VVGREEIGARSTHILELAVNAAGYVRLLEGMMRAPSEEGATEAKEGEEAALAMLAGMKMTERLWVDAEDFLIRQVQVTTLMPVPEMPTSTTEEEKGEGPAVARSMETSVLIVVEEQVLNPDIPDSQFVFVPPEGVKVVDVFELGGAMGGEETNLSGQAAQDFMLTDLEGNSVSLSQFRGKVVVLDFWATWCPPCREEMPELESAYNKYREKGVEVVAVSTDDSKEPVESFVKQNNITFIVLHAPAEKMASIDQFYKITSIPRVLVIDREGTIRADITGYSPGRVEQEIQKVL
jgi:peroxiredoxin